MNSRQGCLLLASTLLSVLFLTGCSSSRKQKFEQREKLAASSGLYCDFVNGEKNKEVELELNVMMAKKCDSDRPYSITNYKSPAEVTGVLYCCAIRKEAKAVESRTSSQKSEVKAEAKAETKTETKAEVKPATKPSAATTPSKDQAPVDKKASQPQDNKGNNPNDLEGEIVPL